jgi:hypothetical protein
MSWVKGEEGSCACNPAYRRSSPAGGRWTPQPQPDVPQACDGRSSAWTSPSIGGRQAEECHRLRAGGFAAPAGWPPWPWPNGLAPSPRTSSCPERQPTPPFSIRGLPSTRRSWTESAHPGRRGRHPLLRFPRRDCLTWTAIPLPAHFASRIHLQSPGCRL